MEFDLNLILVPATLVLLFAWLIDKFILKKHKLVNQHSRLIDLANSHLEKTKKEFSDALVKTGHTPAPDEFIVHEHTPESLKNLNVAYQQARQSLIHAQGGVDKVLPKEPLLVRWAYEYLPILLIILLVRSFVVEPFNIPSSSMVPSLYTGDFILVNKAAYGLKLPLTHTKILSTGSPKHGDVVVFRYPLNEKRYYIKRMIGLPGDTVAFDNGVLKINGTKVETTLADYQMPQALQDTLFQRQIGQHRLTDDERSHLGRTEEQNANYYQEKLGEHSYKVRYLKEALDYVPQFIAKESEVNSQTKWQITVPEGYYFVMGDNRDRSEDSRYWGLVPEKNLAGRASYIWMHKNEGLSIPSFGRVGKID